MVVFSGVPLALVGGVAALALRGMPLSVTAGVGLHRAVGRCRAERLYRVVAARFERDVTALRAQPG